MNYCDYNDYELVYMIKESDENALNILYSKYQPLIIAISSKFIQYAGRIGLDYDDLIQTGNIGLLEAIKSYKDVNNNSFFSFCNLCIKRRIINEINKNNTLRRNVLNECISYDEYSDNDFSLLDILSDENAINPETLVKESYFFDEIIQFKHSLKWEYSLIFELRCNSFTYREISVLLDVSIKKVDNVMIGIKKKLKEWLKQINIYE